MMIKAIFRFGAAVAVSAAASSIVTYLALDPMRRADQAQAVLIGEFVEHYCHWDARHDVEYNIGTMAALSRMTIKAGLGPLTKVELEKCKNAGLLKQSAD
jgi:hypothetical protein